MACTFAYGALAELSPTVAAGAGVPFGAALWLAADELAVPALGLSKPLPEYPPSVHANALAAHLVYSLTTDLVRRAVRRALH
jgi:putative membrane protein